MNLSIRSLIGLCFSFIIAASAQADIVLSITPDNQNVSLGSPASFTINISGLGAGTALGVFDLSVEFDPTILAFNQANFGDPSLGDQLDLAATGLNGPLATPSANSINLIEFSFDDPAILVSQQAGSFALATLSFDTLSWGASALVLTVNSLSDAIGGNISYTTQNGSVTVPSSVPLPNAFWLFLTGSTLLLKKKRQSLRVF